MKKHIILILLFYLSISYSQAQVKSENEFNKIPSCFIKDGRITRIQTKNNFEVLLSQEKKTWHEVNELCEEMESGWYLPSRNTMMKIVDWFKYSSEVNYLWTSNDAMSEPSNYKGQTGYGYYDVADVLNLKTRQTDSKYKSDKCHFVLTRFKGNNFSEIKNSEIIKIGYLEVLKTQLYEVNFYEVKEYTSMLGNGWRLPTRDELNLIYNNENKLSIIYASVDKVIYRSLSDINDGGTYAKNFTNGKGFYTDKKSRFRAFLVKGNSSEHFNNFETYKIGHLEVMNQNLKYATSEEIEYTFSETQDLINKMGNGWRLPTIYELKVIYDNKNMGDNKTFYNSRYRRWNTFWSSTDENKLINPRTKTEYGYGNKWVLDFSDGLCYLGSFGIRKNAILLVRGEESENPKKEQKNQKLKKKKKSKFWESLKKVIKVNINKM